MGWSFGHGDTKQDVINRLTADQKWGTKDGVERHGKCLAKCLRGNILWYVMEITGEDISPERFVGCSILGKEKDYGWGSKDMEESMGPCYYSCPLKYFDMVPDPGGYATEWRAKVRADRQVVASVVKVGAEPVRLKIKAGWRLRGGGGPITEIVVKREGRRLRGWINGCMSRIPRKMLVGAEVISPCHLPGLDQIKIANSGLAVS
jgi:hypothetical protein